MRDDGLFHNVVDDPGTFVETNLAQMFAYSIYESMHGGWLPPRYLKAADRIRAAARAKAATLQSRRLFAAHHPQAERVSRRLRIANVSI